MNFTDEEIGLFVDNYCEHVMGSHPSDNGEIISYLKTIIVPPGMKIGGEDENMRAFAIMFVKNALNGTGGGSGRLGELQDKLTKVMSLPLEEIPLLINDLTVGPYVRWRLSLGK